MWNKFVNAVQLWYYKLNPVKYKPGPFFAAMFKIRTAQAAATVGTTVVTWIGNSRIHEFENLINAVSGWLCQGIGGTKLIKDWIAEWKKVVGPMLIPKKPAVQKLKVIIEDPAGNDFIGGADLETVIKAKQQFITDLKQTVDIVLSLEIVPLTKDVADRLPNWQEVNQKVIGYNTIMSAYRGDEWVALPELSKDGQGLVSYFIADGIHFNENAWPIIQNAVQKKLAEKGIK